MEYSQLIKLAKDPMFSALVECTKIPESEFKKLHAEAIASGQPEAILPTHLLKAWKAKVWKS